MPLFVTLAMLHFAQNVSNRSIFHQKNAFLIDLSNLHLIVAKTKNMLNIEK